MREILFSVVFALMACDGAPGPSPDSGGVPTSGLSCGGVQAGEPCVTDSSIAQCRVREGQCPGEVILLESCPVQFACP